jgi:hypothetical protein
MLSLLTFPCHSVRLAQNQLTGFIPSELGEMTSLNHLWLGTWIGCSFSFECHTCSPFLAIDVPLASNQLMGSIPMELKELTSLAELYIGKYVDWLSCAYESCHACSHFLVVMFDQITMI